MAFFDDKGDQRMAHQNQPAWQALADYVHKAEKDLPKRSWDVLDWGCHEGGLLKDMSEVFLSKVRKLDGVEPDNEARGKATELLKEENSIIYGDLANVPYQSVDVFVSHEVLYLVELDWFLEQLMRVLRPDGAAFVALGSHSENTAWMRWRNVLLEKHGHTSVIHDPWQIVRKADAAGFTAGYQELWPTGYPETNWFSPPSDGWGEFTSMQEALAFRKAKLLFQFWPRS